VIGDNFKRAGPVRCGVRLEPVPDVPALVLKGKDDYVCVADLHLGIETQLRASGFNIPSQAPKMLASLEALSSRAGRLVVLGDVKHRIPSAGAHGHREIRPFMESLLRSFESVTVVVGNHDGGLSEVLPEQCRAVQCHGTRIEDVGLFHGHMWPSEDAMRSEKLVMAHIHPSVVMVDSIGTRTNDKCWLRAKLVKKRALERYDACPQELVVVPAFNPLLTGTPVNSAGGVQLGPLFRNGFVDEGSFDVYLLDGTKLGRPKKLPARERRQRRRYL